MSDDPHRYVERPEEPPVYQHAGKRADSVMINHARLTAAQEQSRATGEPMILLVEGAPYRFSGDPDTPLDSQYLIPYYERKESAIKRKEEMLARLVDRFFGIAQKNISVSRTCNEIDRELTDFVDAYANVQHAAAQRGTDFDLSVPYRDMTEKERQLVEVGSILVGHIVNRLGRTGHIILSGGDTKGLSALEDIKELILRWSATPQEDLESLDHIPKRDRDNLRRELAIKDFDYWSNMLTLGFTLKPETDPDGKIKIRKETPFQYVDAHGEMKQFSHEELVRCVITRNGLRDHDGALGYLIYEIRKIMNDELSISKREHEAEIDPEHFARYKRKEEIAMHETVDKMTTSGIVTTIGLTCAAIDETYSAMCEIADHKRFRHFIDRIKPEEPEIEGQRHDVSHYRGILRQFADAARKRCCIDSRDAINFDKVALEFNHLRDELLWLHDDMTAALNKSAPDFLGRDNKLPIRQALVQLDRGLTLIDSMAQERIPRNKDAPEVYNKKLPAFKGRDASSVGRLKEKVGKWVQDVDTRDGKSTPTPGR